MTATRRRLLALSRDVGSVQAILPVVEALRRTGEVDVALIVPEISHALPAKEGQPFEALDEAAFAADPARCVAALFDRYEPDLVLSGASPARDGPLLPQTPEQYAILEARRRGKKSLGVLDYWGMYGQRFSNERGEILPALLPDTLCVLDPQCRNDLLALGAPAARLAVTHNPWLDRLARESETPPPPGFEGQGGWTILFVSQPLFAFPKEVEPQYRMLRGLIEALPAPPAGGRHQILVWKHPAEPRERWQNPERFATPAVAVRGEKGRGSAFLAHADFLATYHSTVAYEALYYGTPCLSLRFGVQNGGITPQYSEKCGLSFAIETVGDLRSFWAKTDSGALRQRLLTCKKRMQAEGVFFSDGGACARVLTEVRKLLES